MEGVQGERVFEWRWVRTSVSASRHREGQPG